MTMRSSTAPPQNMNHQHDEQELVYELNISPRASIDSQSTTTTTTDIKHRDATPLPPYPPPLLLNQHQHNPSGPHPPSASSFPSSHGATSFSSSSPPPLTPLPNTLDPQPPQSAKDALMHGVGMAALELVGLAVGSLALGSLTSCLWIWVGEINVMAVRRRVYASVTRKDMVWFDLHMGNSEDGGAEGEGVVGAAGLMAKFSRETDDVRNASSLASGTIIQYLTTCVACLLLAFLRSYQLTFVILSAVPLLMVIQGFSQGIAGPLLHAERQETAIAATLIERALAFNAAPSELLRAQRIFSTLRTQARKLNTVWGLTSGLAQFVMMAMFVQGFWFGAKLVREGRVSAGDVMAVFWACLIATSNLQMEGAMRALVGLVGDETPAVPPTPTTPRRHRHAKSPRTLRKITPPKCTGELALYNVSFAYPSRPSIPVLSNVSLFLPAQETTFIVGGSGSGKSTVAQLLLGMYTLDEARGDAGMVAIDEQDVRFLDREWVREWVGGVGQAGGAGVVVLDGKSVFDNVALGFSDSDNTASPETEEAKRQKVEDACRAALLHTFIRDLPQGYDTPLAGGANGAGAGIGLSGGQRQRLAIARARLRNPRNSKTNVRTYITDEATSALDHTTRLLVFAALKAWRRNLTTVVITHDLSQIESGDFVYVLKGGRVVEQGYRGDLEVVGVKGGEEETEDVDGGEFRKMMEAQMATGGYLPEKDVPVAPSPAPLPALDDDATDNQVDDDEHEEQQHKRSATPMPQHQSLAIRPLTFGNWMFEVVADLTGVRSGSALPASHVNNNRLTRNYNTNANANNTSEDGQRRKRRPSSIQIAITSPAGEDRLDRKDLTSRRYSLPFTPTSPTSTVTVVEKERRSTKWGYGWKDEDGFEFVDEQDEEDFDKEKSTMARSAFTARQGRERRERRGWDEKAVTEEGQIKKSMFRRRRTTPSSPSANDTQTQTEQATEDLDDTERPPFFALMRRILPTIPHKPLLFLGLLISALSGAMTPIFSFLLSRLLFEVSSGAQDTHAINKFGGIVLGIAALDGLLLGSKYFVMETCGMLWTTRIRGLSLRRVLAQDKKWFDRPANAPARLVQILVRDGDDARNLISVVWGQFFVVAAMLGVGLTWAMVRGWQLTLAGFAIAPVFAITMAVQTRLVARCEVRNKRAREEVARGYYEAIINVRGIRCMAFEPVFQKQFDVATDKALSTGVRGAFVEGCTYGVASGLIYLAEALLFYIGAILIARGQYTYLQMVEVLNLVVFSVTIGSQLMAFTEKIAKSVQATSDFHKLMSLDMDTDESHGKLLPDLSSPTSNSDITFTHVDFAYPERPEASVLKDVNLTIASGECVAIVGASGSGKSTLAALLQRLYEPTQGYIELGAARLADVDVRHLREHVSVVSQTPNLFDATIAENIRYGSDTLGAGASAAEEDGTTEARWVDEVDVRRAAKKANVHEFIMGLPQGYDTMVGENAALISGGQAQRLQIARALARPARVLILDECTSALDAENQVAVLETIAGLAKGEERRTTVMVTHKMQVMRMCDRIVVLHEGEVREQGTYEELMEMKGVFATLASGGEWVGE
ncbi:P-loop containing nucleoside triphosphate hydrolase protein [Flammula alnicola]|nr:P-loop containing nucleoside triphosphate hydrolase protein [Flammula alnicola]